MGEAKRRKLPHRQSDWPRSDSLWDIIDLHELPPIASINGTRMRALTGDDRIPENTQVILRAFRAVVGERTFHVGFCLGDGTQFSAVGIAVIDRLMTEAPESTLYVVPIVHEDIAWDLVLRQLRSFTGQTLLFAFPNSDVYDAGTAEIHYSDRIRYFREANQLKQLTAADHRRVRAQKAAIMNRPPPPVFYPATGVEQEELPWIFRVTTPAGKTILTTAWNGRRNYAHELPDDIIRCVGGNKIAIVQVDSPVGVNRRSSFDLTHKLSKDFDAVIHWARDTETYQSIVTSFVRLDIESVKSPDLPANWKPDITILEANRD